MEKLAFLNHNDGINATYWLPLHERGLKLEVKLSLPEATCTFILHSKYVQEAKKPQDMTKKTPAVIIVKYHQLKSDHFRKFIE